MNQPKTIKIDNVEYIRTDSIQKQIAEIEPKTANYFIGRKWFIRTVTYHMTGLCTGILKDGPFIILLFSNGAWISDSGRFESAIKNGEFNEVEPTGNHNVNLGSVVDFFEFNHELPEIQK